MRIIIGWLLLVIHTTLVCCACTSIPLSLDNLNYCEDDTCYYKQQTTLSIPVAHGSSSCLEFTPPPPSTDIVYFNFTVVSSFYSWTVDYCYYTDDPKIDFKAFCGCPGGTTAVCGACPNSDVQGTTVLCSSGTHSSPYCPLTKIGRAGTWCANTGLMAFQRYKICRLLPVPDLEITIAGIVSNKQEEKTETLAFTFRGIPEEFVNVNSRFDVTFVSSTTIPEINPGFYLFDKHAMDDFYILEDSDVNSINQYVPSKIGWLKVITSNGNVTKTDPGIGSQIVVIQDDCQNNRFHANFPWANINDLLHQRTNRLSSRLYPDSTLIDSEFKHKHSDTGMPQHDINPYTYLKSGVILFDGSGIRFMGITTDGVVTGYDWSNGDLSVTGLPLLDQHGVLRTGFPLALRAHHLSWPTTQYLWMAFIPTNIAPPEFSTKETLLFGVCCGNNASFPAKCAGCQFNAVTWPDFYSTIITFDGSFKRTMTSDISGPGRFLAHQHIGVLTTTLAFKNMTVKFITTNVRPVIDSVHVDDTSTALLMIRSTTIAGTCYLGAVPARMSSILDVDLTIIPQLFKLPLTKTVYNGTLILLVTCHKYSANVSLDYSSDQAGIVDNESAASENIYDSISNWLPNLFGIKSDVGRSILKIGFVILLCFIAICILLPLLTLVGYGLVYAFSLWKTYSAPFSIIVTMMKSIFFAPFRVMKRLYSAIRPKMHKKLKVVDEESRTFQPVRSDTSKVAYRSRFAKDFFTPNVKD